MIATHVDSCCLKVRPVSKKEKAGYLQVACELYGGVRLRSVVVTVVSASTGADVPFFFSFSGPLEDLVRPYVLLRYAHIR